MAEKSNGHMNGDFVQEHENDKVSDFIGISERNSLDKRIALTDNEHINLRRSETYQKLVFNSYLLSRNIEVGFFYLFNFFSQIIFHKI